MLKCQEFNKVNGSAGNSETSIDAAEKAGNNTGMDLVYEAGKSYYNYLSNMKSEESSGNSDYCTVFMML
ncbi:hypothetical protein N4T77_17625 [Clostridium sp. CX1]|uniref:hypothetical protein n=1 Tax=Clostridium sp. CX1 TaxID=2978346 RepID=UPI0021BFC592|nr:hypothetical protein [Clostridium sp. CX1]MCT8978412.1 hypothetical protein [Clostridium sp. CX1]